MLLWTRWFYWSHGIKVDIHSCDTPPANCPTAPCRTQEALPRYCKILNLYSRSRSLWICANSTHTIDPARRLIITSVFFWCRDINGGWCPKITTISKLISLLHTHLYIITIKQLSPDSLISLSWHEYILSFLSASSPWYLLSLVGQQQVRLSQRT